MKRRALAALLALWGSGTAAVEAQLSAPAAGTEFAMRCDGASVSRWLIARNEAGVLRVQSAADAEVYREGPVWGYLLGDIYDVQGLGAGRGRNRMFLLRGPAEGVKRLEVGARHRFTYRWLSPRGEAERTHVITIRAHKRVRSEDFGELEVFEVTDDVSSPMHDLRRSVDYAPALGLFVRFAIRNNRSGFEQNCVLSALRTP